MRDLNQITQQNHEASFGEIASDLSKGKHVITRYEGLHYISHDNYADRESADSALEQKIKNAEVGDKFALLTPTAEAATA